MTSAVSLVEGSFGRAMNLTKMVKEVSQYIIYHGLEHRGALVSPKGMTRYS